MKIVLVDLVAFDTSARCSTELQLPGIGSDTKKTPRKAVLSKLDCGFHQILIELVLGDCCCTIGSSRRLTLKFGTYDWQITELGA